MIKLKTLLMEADAPKLKDTEKEKAKKLGLVWKGKGYGKEGDDGITHKNDGGKLVKIDKDGGKEEPKSKGLSGSDFDRELPSDEPKSDEKEKSPTSTFDAPIEPKEINPKDVKKAASHIEKTDPKLADEIRRDLFTLQRFGGWSDIVGKFTEPFTYAGKPTKSGIEAEKAGNALLDKIRDFNKKNSDDKPKSDEPKSDEPVVKKGEPVEIDDDAQETIDSFDWNEFGDRNGDPNLAKTTNEMGGMTDEWNAQINQVWDEMSGQIPREDLEKLEMANIDDDYGGDLNDVPRDEFRDKIKILIDFHKKYSTIGKKTTAQEKDPNRKKVSGIKPGSSFGSNIGYRTGGNRGGGMYDNVNIKLKDVMKESKVSYLVEALQSKLLRKFTNRQDFKLDNDFYGWLARLGVRADKVTDDMIEKTAKLSGKGVVIAVTGKKVSLPAKGKSYWRSDLEVDKGVVLSVFKDGKAVWWTKSWRESEKNRKRDIRVADTKGYGFSTSENRTFGLNQFGYQNAASVKKINGVEFYKISLEENMPYMGGKEVRKLRSDIQVGSWKWRDDESFKRQNKDKYEDAIKAMYDDPEKVKAKVKRAKDYTDGLITGLIGGKPNAAAKKLLKGLSSTRAPEMQAMELMRNITDAMDRLYDKVTYYNNAVKDDIDYEKRNPEHPKSYRNAPRYGKEVAEIVNLILKNKFRGYY